MTEVLQMPAASGTDPLHQSTGLRRSHSSSPSLLFLDTSNNSSSPLPQLLTATASLRPDTDSSPSPRSLSTSSLESYGTKATSRTTISPPKNNVLTLTEQIDSPDDISFADYEGSHFSYRSSTQSHANYSDEPEISTTTDTTRSDSPLPTPTTVDDTAIRLEPSRHVDYLNHDWREEDIWASWRHIISRRKVYGHSSRLENASWRTWAKSKYRLRTVPPETLNWLKESDVTWLYGPLQPAASHPITSETSGPISQLSKSGSFTSKKPILKKRSVSEVMLQRSLSTSSLVAQAAASVQAQQSRSPVRNRIHRTNSDFVFGSSNESSQQTSCEQLDYFSSEAASSAGTTPGGSQREKHIRFDDTVEQCIAVECKYGYCYEDDAETEDDSRMSSLSDSSSDECLMIKPSTHRPPFSRENSTKDKPTRNSSFNAKMIETIASTTLKYRTESPDPTLQQPQHHVFGGGKNWSNNRLSSSPSLETLRPSRPSRNFLLADDDDEDEAETDSAWSFGASNPKSSLGASADAGPSDDKRRRKHTWNPSEAYDGAEMRRTNSGMLMPYDEDEDDIVATGLFGRITDTINTAKDIGHVLWNVGWGK